MVKLTEVGRRFLALVLIAGLGVGLLFASSVRNELAEGTLVRLPVADPLLQQRHCIVHHVDTDLTPLAGEFAAYVRDALSPLTPV